MFLKSVVGVPQQNVQSQPDTLEAQFQRAVACWDPNSSRCQFVQYFYNMVHPSEVHLYGPPPGQDPSLYEQAQRDNPDPKCMVPVLAVGFEDIKKRLSMQEETSRAHTAKLTEIKEQLEALKRKHYLDTVAKLQDYKRRQIKLAGKTLRIMKNVQLIRNRGYSIRVEEEKFQSRLSAMERELQRPAVFRGRLNEIWAHLQQTKSFKEFSSVRSNSDLWSVVNNDQLKQIFQTLNEHQSGLAAITEVVQDDEKVASRILREYEEVGFAKS
ncbi:nucleoporin complex subunit 54-domain-containing protein [Phlyctochytrium arcticum]|nr:nucleoporin complex subunit 54-domain-containing protein [Phlyctochytrium arcticum]